MCVEERRRQLRGKGRGFVDCADRAVQELPYRSITRKTVGTVHVRVSVYGETSDVVLDRWREASSSNGVTLDVAQRSSKSGSHGRCTPILDFLMTHKVGKVRVDCAGSVKKLQTDAPGMGWRLSCAFKMVVL